MSLSKLQISTLGCILDVLELQRPDELTPEQNQALIECFNSLVKEKGKGGKSKKSKEKSDDALPKPGNSWIAWLKENRDSIKEQNDGKEEGLPALLSKAYNDFKKTPAYNVLKKECDEKMKEYKEKSNASDDDEPKKKTKTKKVEKSSEEKKPLNVYMAYCKEQQDEIKAYASSTGKPYNEAKQEMYAKFKETKEFKTLEAKCKAEMKLWNEKAPVQKKQSVASESSDDEVVVAPPKPVVQKPKKKEVVSSESESVPVKKADKKDKKADKKVKTDKKNVPSEDEDEPVKKKAEKKADKKAKKVEEMPEPVKNKKVEKKKKVEEPPVEDEPPLEDEPEYEAPAEDEPEYEAPAEDEE